ncbi:hypothetical protein SGRIM128S_01163 [Streptomyces griseomycini]
MIVQGGRDGTQVMPPETPLLAAPEGCAAASLTMLRKGLRMYPDPPAPRPPNGRVTAYQAHPDDRRRHLSEPRRRSSVTASFEAGGRTIDLPAHKRHRGRVRGYRHGRFYDGPYVAAYGNGGGKPSVPELQAAMGIDWTDVREELTEAIPPAYTEWIGAAFLATATLGVAA